MIVVLAAATFARAYLVTWLGERVIADLRGDVYDHVIGLSPGFFELTRTGEVLSRLTSDAAVIQTVISASLSQALRNILLLIGGLALLVSTNPKLTGAGAGGGAAGGGADRGDRAQGAAAVAPRPGPDRRARRADRGDPERGAHGAGLRPGGPRAQPLRQPQRAGVRRRGRAGLGARPARGLRDRAGARRDRRGALGRRPRRARRHDQRRRAGGVRVLRLGGRDRDRRAQRDHGRSAARRGGDRADVRAARHAARDHGPGTAVALAGAGTRRGALRRGRLRLSGPARLPGAASASTSRSRPARRSPWSVRPAPARAACSSC